MKHSQWCCTLSALLFLSGAFISLSAQSVCIGGRAGLHLANIEIRNGSSLTVGTENRAGLDVGLLLEIGVAEGFRLQPELHYLQQGFRLDFDFLGDKVKSNTVLHYLHLPALAKYRFNIGEGPVAGFFLGGPTFGYAMSGKTIARSGGEKESEDVEFGEGGLRRFDFGLSFGAGAELATGTTRLFVEARYLLGIANIANPVEPRDESALRNRGITFAVGFLKPIGSQ